jgi:DNA-damage-inducible protein J
MASVETVRARIDSALKRDASEALAEMGLTVSEAIRLMLIRVASDKALPFDVRSPNAKTTQALKAAESGDVVSHTSIASMMADLDDEDGKQA